MLTFRVIGWLPPLTVIYLTFIDPATVRAAEGQLAADSTFDARTVIAMVIACRDSSLLQIDRGGRFRLYTKLVTRDADIGADSDSSIVGLEETERIVVWRRRAYQEVVVGERHLSGSPGHGILSVTEIANSARDWITLEDQETASGRLRAAGHSTGTGQTANQTWGSIRLPIADGSLARYEFRLVDTITTPLGRGFRIAFEPRSRTALLFTGTIDVTDSSWRVVALDLEIDHRRLPAGLDHLSYHVRFNLAVRDLVPQEIRFGGEIRPRISSRWIPRRIAGIRFGGVPRHLRFEQVAIIDSAETGTFRPSLPSDYGVIVAPGREAGIPVPWPSLETRYLTDAEHAVLERDRRSARRSLIRRGLRRVARSVDRFDARPMIHYNRVDGLFAGVTTDWRASPRWRLELAAGDAFGQDALQYRVGATVRPSRSLWIRANYHDQTTARSTIFSTNYNPSLRALFARRDPLAYYRDHGGELAAEVRPLRSFRLTVGITDTRQTSLDTVKTLSLFGAHDRTPIPNPPITDGHLRSMTSSIAFDYRKLLAVKGSEYPLVDRSWTRVEVTAEIAEPSVLPSNFAFRRYFAQLRRVQSTAELGRTSVILAAGAVTGTVPPQRYLTVDPGMGFLARDGNGFRTLERTSYSGNRLALVSISHEFGSRLFASSGIPGVTTIPFTLTLNAGVFWTTFLDHAPLAQDTLFATAPTGYREVGFSLGNLTPFLAPFNFAAQFAWQLSNYRTRRFRFGLGLSR